MSEHVLVTGYTCKICNRVLTIGESWYTELTICPYCNVQGDNRAYAPFCPTISAGHAGVNGTCYVCTKCYGKWAPTVAVNENIYLRCIKCSGTGIARATCSHGETGSHILEEK